MDQLNPFISELTHARVNNALIGFRLKEEGPKEYWLVRRVWTPKGGKQATFLQELPVKVRSEAHFLTRGKIGHWSECLISPHQQAQIDLIMWDRLSCSCSRQKPPPSIVVHAFNMFSTEFMFSLTESLFTAGARTPRVIPLISTRDYGYSRAIASKASQYLPHLNLLYPNPPAQKQNKERQKLEKKRVVGLSCIFARLAFLAVISYFTQPACFVDFLLAVSYVTQAAKVRAGWRLVFLLSFGWAAGIALLASAWIDQRLGVVVMFVHSSHPASKGKTT